MPRPRIAVVGAGIAGLAAALRLRALRPDAAIVLYDGSPHPGGKLRTGVVAGGPVERGAEAFLMHDLPGSARPPGSAQLPGPAQPPGSARPSVGPSAAVELVRRLGLGDEIVHPEPVPAAILVNGELRDLPGGTLLGIPTDLSLVDGVARVDPRLDRDEGRPLLEPDEDVSVGALVRRRLGDDLVDRLVDPLLGGVYAGRADGLSLRATMPGLAATAEKESTLVGAARAAVSASAAHRGSGPVFGTVRGGLSRVVDAAMSVLVPTASLDSGALPDVEVRLGEPVRELTPTAGGWRLIAGSKAGLVPRIEDVDAVILALPAGPASRLLIGASLADAGEQVGVLDYASVALVSLALPVSALSGMELPALSGFLVPAGEGLTIKAATFVDCKWAHHSRDDGTVVVRASIGRYRDVDALRRTDDELAALVCRELAAVLGRALPAPTDAAVTRWGGALPQYAPGHPDRVTRARAALPATLALAGAAYDGVGIPACVRSGEAAADGIVAELPA